MRAGVPPITQSSHSISLNNGIFTPSKLKASKALNQGNNFNTLSNLPVKPKVKEDEEQPKNGGGKIHNIIEEAPLTGWWLIMRSEK